MGRLELGCAVAAIGRGRRKDEARWLVLVRPPKSRLLHSGAAPWGLLAGDAPSARAGDVPPFGLAARRATQHFRLPGGSRQEAAAVAQEHGPGEGWPAASECLRPLAQTPVRFTLL